MLQLEIFTDQRRILLNLSFFISNLLQFGLISAGTLNRDILVLDKPCQVIDFADDIQGFLPGLLGYLQAHLALYIGSKYNIHTRSHGKGAEYGIIVHIHKGEVI